MNKIPCEVYSRIAGYLRPVSGWNIGKKREFENRVPFKVPQLKNASVPGELNYISQPEEN